MAQGKKQITALSGSFILKKSAFIFSLFFLFPNALYAWGEAGHRIAADVAERYLEKRTRAEIKSLIAGASLASVADWADRIRGDRPETGHWHFVNIPFESSHYDPKRDCALPAQGDCVVGAIERFRKILSDPARPSPARAEALKFLVHLVADLHQPLHTVSRGDHGGNDLTVSFFGEKVHPSGKPWNLHAVWDGGLIHRAGMSEPVYADHLQLWLEKKSPADFQKGTVADWAMEAHRAAVAVAYRIPGNRNLSEDYFEKSLPVMDELLAKAGVRLARVLNEALQTGKERKEHP